MEQFMLSQCRLCLENDDQTNMFELFETVDNNKGSNLLYKFVEYCIGVRLNDGAHMPTKICQQCFEIVLIWYNLRKVSLKAQLYWESLNNKQQDVEKILNKLNIERTISPNLNVKNEIVQCVDEYIDSMGETEDDYLESVIENDKQHDNEADLLQQVLLNVKQEQNDQSCTDRDHNFEHSNNDNVNGSVLQFENYDKMILKTLRKKKSANSRISQKKRSRRSSPPPTSFLCVICGNAYAQKNSFKYHMAQHQDHRPHECEICGKSFRQVCELKSHIRRHTGERPFKCSHCDRRFIDRSEKHRHEKTHTNTRPYTCQECGKSFMYSTILKNHMKSHSGEKNFNCLICSKSFTLQHQLKAHLSTATHRNKAALLCIDGHEIS